MSRFPAVLVLCGLAGCGGTGARVNSGSEPSSGQILLLDVDGQPFDLWRQTRAPVTVFIFTRTDCPISNRFAPEIRRLYGAYHARGVELYLVYVDPREDAETIRRHLKEYEYPCPALRDPKHTLVARCH